MGEETESETKQPISDGKDSRENAKFQHPIGAAVVWFVSGPSSPCHVWPDQSPQRRRFHFFALSRIHIGFGLPLMSLAITRSSYNSIPRDKVDRGAVLITLARNVGRPIGVALNNNTLARRSGLVELIDPSGDPYQETLKQVTKYFIASGSSVSHAPGLRLNRKPMQIQASLLASIDVFWTLMLIVAAIVPFALLWRRVEFAARSPMAPGERAQVLRSGRHT